VEKFTTFKGKIAVLDMNDVDTDQILPRQFLKLIERGDFGKFLFHHHRFDARRELNPDFELNRPRWKGASILLTGANFGCGSSREHAVWALFDYGFRVLIGPGFADIFKGNCFKIGLLPIELEIGLLDELRDRARAQEGYHIEVDLERQALSGPDGFSCSFKVDPFQRRRLLDGLDDIAAALLQEPRIRSYEEAHSLPWQAFVNTSENAAPQASSALTSDTSQEARL
jgi:3-isopropylmalate/(R)-2-methylmalate dehydratase small subunit